MTINNLKIFNCIEVFKLAVNQENSVNNREEVNEPIYKFVNIK